MIKYQTWTITVLLLLAYSTAYYYGIVDYLLSVDRTFISFIIPALVLKVSLIVNLMTFTKRYPRMIRKLIEYVSLNMTFLGMLGTALGLFFATQHGMPSAAQILPSISMALTTTIAGIGGSFVTELLIIQLEEDRRNAERKV